MKNIVLKIFILIIVINILLSFSSCAGPAGSNDSKGESAHLSAPTTTNTTDQTKDTDDVSKDNNKAKNTGEITISYGRGMQTMTLNLGMKYEEALELIEENDIYKIKDNFIKTSYCILEFENNQLKDSLFSV